MFTIRRQTCILLPRAKNLFMSQTSPHPTLPPRFPVPLCIYREGEYIADTPKKGASPPFLATSLQRNSTATGIRCKLNRRCKRLHLQRRFSTKPPRESKLREHVSLSGGVESLSKSSIQPEVVINFIVKNSTNPRGAFHPEHPV